MLLLSSLFQLDHKYDLGPFQNLKAILGSSILLWPFPTAPEGDGIHFRFGDAYLNAARALLPPQHKQQRLAPPGLASPKTPTNVSDSFSAVFAAAAASGHVVSQREDGEVIELSNVITL